MRKPETPLSIPGYAFQKRYPDTLILRLLILLLVPLSDSVEKFSPVKWHYESNSQKMDQYGGVMCYKYSVYITLYIIIGY